MNNRKKIVFIINPISGVSGKINWITLATRMLAKDYDLEFKQTLYKGHACKLAQEAVNTKIAIVCAVGGDGTVNEIASALIGTDTALAILPLGSGNGLARELGISTLLPNRAIEIIRNGNIKKIDHGLVNGIPFFCTCGVGFDALISQKFAKRKRRGIFGYLMLIIKEYFKYNPQIISLHTKDKIITRKAFLVNCANTRQFGNNAYIAPKADFTDGLMNITIVKPVKMLNAIRLSMTLFDKRINSLNYTETFECDKVVLEIPEGAAFHYDGEPIELDRKVHVSIVKHDLNVIVPQSLL